MAKLYNLARMTTATTGTGTITLGAAVSGYLSFAAAGVANGDVVDYAIKDGANSEHGTGTYASSGTTLSRTVTKSTNGNAAISLSGTAEVFISPRAETLNDGSLLTTGTVADARLSSNVPLKNASNTFTGTNTFSNVSAFNQNVTIGAGTLFINNSIGGSGGIQQSGAGCSFAYTTANSGAYQFATNFGSGQTIINPSNTGAPFWFVSSDAGGAGAAGYSLHRGGAYAVNVGLSTDNTYYIGGWSDGGGVYRWAVTASGAGFLPSSLTVAGISPYAAGAVGAKNTAKAWVAFNGSTAGIIAQYNVSSITRNAAGDYTINFANSLGTTSYSVMGSIQTASVFSVQVFDLLAAPSSAASFRFRSIGQDGNLRDVPYACVGVFA